MKLGREVEERREPPTTTTTFYSKGTHYAFLAPPYLYSKTLIAPIVQLFSLTFLCPAGGAGGWGFSAYCESCVTEIIRDFPYLRHHRESQQEKKVSNCEFKQSAT